MKRIGRYILNGLTVLSLVLCVGTVGLWVRSYSVADVFEKHGSRAMIIKGRQQFVDEYRQWESTRGGLEYVHARSEPYLAWDKGTYQLWARTRLPAHAFALPARHGGRQWGFAGFVLARYPFNRIDWLNYPGPLKDPAVLARVPYWMLIVVFAALPTSWLWGARRGRQSVTGRCARCGYDLRATPDRCPECGTIPTKVKA